MSSDFDRAFAVTVGVEGGFSTDQNDNGNWTGGRKGVGQFKGTKFGISAARYPTLDIRNLTLEQAKEIYERDYWQRFAVLPWPWNALMFDFVVNPGPGRPVAMDLQRALGVMEDGVVGPKTIAQAGASNTRHVARLMRLRMQRMQAAVTWPIHGNGWCERLFAVTADVMLATSNRGTA